MTANSFDCAFFTIKGWGSLQHYKNRRPAWIKFYQEILDDPNYLMLTDVAKCHLHHLWLVAAQTWNPEETPDPVLKNEPKLLKKLAKTEKKLKLLELFSAGFLVPILNDFNDIEKNVASERLAPSISISYSEGISKDSISGQKEIKKDNAEKKGNLSADDDIILHPSTDELYNKKTGEFLF